MRKRMPRDCAELAVLRFRRQCLTACPETVLNWLFFETVLDDGARLCRVTEFDYLPIVSKRSHYVGLKNAGATCYLNSSLQQLFMQVQGALLLAF